MLSVFFVRGWGVIRRMGERQRRLRDVRGFRTPGEYGGDFLSAMG